MKRSLILAAGLALGVAGFSMADNTGSAVRSGTILTGIKAGQPTRMVFELEAKARVLFIPATGKAVFNAEIKPDNYVINSKVKVTGIADWFINYDMTLQASGYTRGDQLKTYYYSSQNRDGKKNRRVQMTIPGPASFDMTATPRFGNLGDPAATPAQAYAANDPITALISFAMEPRAPGADPCGGPLKIFDGRQLTHLHLKNAGTKHIKTSAWKGQAIECHVTMDKVAGYKTGEADNDNLTGIDGPLRMYLAPLDNGATVPIKIVADTDKIGKVTLQAKKLRFEPITTDEASRGQGGG
jgi:hypothetical protein